MTFLSEKIWKGKIEVFKIYGKNESSILAKSAGVVEYTDCFSAEG